MNLELIDKTALISGSTKGIGFAIAKALAAEGVRVIINGRSEARVTEAIAAIRGQIPSAKLDGLALDLSKADATGDPRQNLRATFHDQTSAKRHWLGLSNHSGHRSKPWRIS